eukprot:7155207-Prymnesium_polylepis.1
MRHAPSPPPSGRRASRSSSRAARRGAIARCHRPAPQAPSHSRTALRPARLRSTRRRPAASRGWCEESPCSRDPASSPPRQQPPPRQRPPPRPVPPARPAALIAAPLPAPMAAAAEAVARPTPRRLPPSRSSAAPPSAAHAARRHASVPTAARRSTRRCPLSAARSASAVPHRRRARRRARSVGSPRRAARRAPPRAMRRTTARRLPRAAWLAARAAGSSLSRRSRAARRATMTRPCTTARCAGVREHVSRRDPSEPTHTRAATFKPSHGPLSNAYGVNHVARGSPDVPEGAVVVAAAPPTEGQTPGASAPTPAPLQGDPTTDTDQQERKLNISQLRWLAEALEPETPSEGATPSSRSDT